jgi:mannose-6-phosphate isomerase-like protein (cupin superfamily)
MTVARERVMRLKAGCPLSWPCRFETQSIKEKIMTTHTANLNSFTLGAQEGRTAEPLHVFGGEVLVKLANADTNGAAAILHVRVPPMSGPPLHRHSREDEWFYVLSGEITAVIDGKKAVVREGGSFFAPCGTAHTFQNFGRDSAQMLTMIAPGDLVGFFEELATLNKTNSAAEPIRAEQLRKEYGIEVLGPPLSTGS